MADANANALDSMFANKDLQALLVTNLATLHLAPFLTLQHYLHPLQELGGAPPPELMGDMGGSTPGGGPGVGARKRFPGDELPDDCKLYVGNLSSAFNDNMLKAMFEPFGSVLHATVLLDMTSVRYHGGSVLGFSDVVRGLRKRQWSLILDTSRIELFTVWIMVIHDT